jgi:hypothetical protein
MKLNMRSNLKTDRKKRDAAMAKKGGGDARQWTR